MPFVRSSLASLEYKCFLARVESVYIYIYKYIGFGRFSTELGPKTSSRSTELAFLCILHKEAAPQTISNGISCFFVLGGQQVCIQKYIYIAPRRPVCVFALGVRALLISVSCCFGRLRPRCRPQDLVERVGFEISCRNQGSLPSGIGSEAILAVGGPPRGPPCAIRKNVFCVPQRSLKSI
jgi:hypothetical protein